jgi:hypothetical protein
VNRSTSHSLRLITVLLAVFFVLSACGEQSLPFVPTPEPTPEQPREVAVLIVDRASEEPIADASVTVDGETALTGADGTVTLTAMRGAGIEVVAADHDPGEARVPDEGDLTVALRLNVVTGTVLDAEGEPIGGLRVFVEDSDLVARTESDGSYRLEGLPEDASLVFKMPGYRLGEAVVTGQAVQDAVMQPFVARGLYAPSAVFEAPGRLDALLAQIERTEVNAVVIDVKETDGRLYYATDLPEAVEIGAVREHPVFDLEEVLAMFGERGVYTIARMVVMKDNTLGAARPELAVRNNVTGEPWRDNIGGVWLDPSAPGVAEYTAAVAADLADRGFDEVQLDYIRYYSDGPYGLADTILPNTQSFRLPSIRRVMRVVSEEFETRRAFLSADVFPISFIASDDQGIGQRPEVMMPYVDYFSPMVYPSHYGPGVFGIMNPNEHPYEVISETLKVMNVQAEGLPVVIRPWIQDFGYGPHRAYTEADVRAEMRAIDDNDAQGWMIWNARAIFTESALGPPRPDESFEPVDMTDVSPPSSGEASPAPSPSS